MTLPRPQRISPVSPPGALLERVDVQPRLRRFEQGEGRGLSDDDRTAIEGLCTSMRKPTPGKIAQKLGRDVGTVAWFMIRNGLIERKISYGGPVSYMQGGKLVYRYTEQHDRRMLELRVAGKSAREIAKTISEEFGVARTAHSVDVRLTMLAAYEGGPEALSP